MPGGGADDALGRPGRAGGVKDIGRVVALHRHAIGGLDAVLELMPGDIATGGQLGNLLLALEDHAEIGLVVGQVDGGVEKGFVVDCAVGFDAATGRDDRLRRAVVDADGQFVGGKPAEDDRMDGTQAGAGQHRLQRLGDHGHVDDDAVALGDALGLQRARQAGNAVLKLGVGDDVFRAGDGAVVEDGGLLAPARGDMAVDGVPAGVDGGVGEPFVQGRAAVVQGAGGFADPVDPTGGAHPEPLGVLLPLAIHLCVAHRDLPPADVVCGWWYAMGCPSRNGVTGSGVRLICRICGERARIFAKSPGTAKPAGLYRPALQRGGGILENSASEPLKAPVRFL